MLDDDGQNGAKVAESGSRTYTVKCESGVTVKVTTRVVPCECGEWLAEVCCDHSGARDVDWCRACGSIAYHYDGGLFMRVAPTK